MTSKKYKIELRLEEKETLEAIVRKQTTAQNIARRARIPSSKSPALGRGKKRHSDSSQTV
ncbi:hypothetical protein KKC13_10855 [bacterium]|nr:hypothetical protein [bacterium]MBU1958206.1 hypothetical protein [bacterium]